MGRRKKTYIVTGGAGFIGSHVAKRLLARGDRVVVLDDLSTGQEENIPSTAEFIRFDVSRRRDYAKIKKLDDVDAVLHLAAQSSGEISFSDPVRDLEVNVAGSLLLLDWCLEHRVSRFMEASSYTIYGKQTRSPLKVSFKPNPQSYYAVGKWAVENYLKLYEKRGIDFTVLRMGNIYGPGQNLQNMKQGMVSIYFAYIIKNEPIVVRGSLRRYRDFMYIDDTVEYWIRGLNRKQTFGKVYNLGIGEGNSVREVIERLLEGMGHDPDRYPIIRAPSTPGDVHGYYGDISETVKDFGYSPRYDLKKGIAKMTNIYRRQFVKN